MLGAKAFYGMPLSAQTVTSMTIKKTESGNFTDPVFFILINLSEAMLQAS